MNFQDNRYLLHNSGGQTMVFEASNQDLTDSTYQYFGYISAFGSWIVQRFHIIGDAIIYGYFAGQTRTVYDALWDADGKYVGGLTFTTYDQIAEDL